MKRVASRRLLAAVVLTACSSFLPLSAVHAETPEKPRIALVMKSLANEFFLTMEDGAKAYQKEHADRFELVSNGIKDETDTSSQIRIVEQMIVSGVDALVIAPADSKALVPVVKKALDAGIVVVNIDNRFDPQVLQAKKIGVPFVGPDNRKGARLVGEYLAKRLKAGDEVGIIEGSHDHQCPAAHRRLQGCDGRGGDEDRLLAVGQLGNREGQRGGLGDAQRAS